MKAEVLSFKLKCTHTTKQNPKCNADCCPLKLENSFKKETSKSLPVRKCKPAFKSGFFGTACFSHLEERIKVLEIWKQFIQFCKLQGLRPQKAHILLDVVCNKSIGFEQMNGFC